MREFISAVLVGMLATAPAYAAPLVLTLAEAQIETTPSPTARPPDPNAPPPAEVPPLESTPQGEVITPIEDPNKTTTTTTTTTQAQARTGGLTGLQWVGIGLAVLAVGALAAGGGGGGDEPAPPSSGGN